jgi:hypothetical protein
MAARVGRVLLKHLHLHPYNIAVHELKERDRQAEYCPWFRDVITANEEDMLNVTFFTLEGWFYLSVYVNRRNSRVLSETNRHEIKDAPFHDQKVGVWCSISRNRKSGHIIFDDTINSESYCDVTVYLFIGSLHGDEIARGHFQQDRTHTARVSITRLCHSFGDRIISNDIGPLLPLDLTPLNVVYGSNERHSLKRQSSHSP